MGFHRDNWDNWHNFMVHGSCSFTYNLLVSKWQKTSGQVMDYKPLAND